MKVSTADFIKNFSTLADKALQEPVTITKNDRDRLVLISAEEYVRLKSRERRAVKLEDFAGEEIALIASTEPAPEDAVLDEELSGWKP